MARLDDCPHVSARVRVGRNLATEYDPPDGQVADAKTDIERFSCPLKECYIESETDAEFSIEITYASSFQFNKGHDHLVASVSLDGNEEIYHITPAEDIRGRSHTSIISKAPDATEDENEQTRLYSFVFSPIVRSETADWSKISEDQQRAETLGTIDVLIMTVQSDKETACPQPKRSRLQHFDIAEEALKGQGQTHVTLLRESTQVAATQWIKICEMEKMARFLFRYQSLKALEDAMIITRPAQPEHSDASGSDDDPFRSPSGPDGIVSKQGLHIPPDKKADQSVLKRRADSAITSRRPYKIIRESDGQEVVDLTSD